MDYNEFGNSIIEILENLVEEDITLCVSTNVKNNGLKVNGIIFKKEDVNIAPTIYLERFYEEYERGVDLDEIARRIMAIYKENVIEYDVSFDSFTDYEKAKKSLYVRLINYDKNQERLQNAPYRKYLDLAMVVYYCIDLKPFNNATVLVLNEHLKSWGKDAEEVISEALENTFKNMKCYTTPIVDVLDKRMIPNDMNDVWNYESIPMKVVSNDKQFYGAVFMCMQEKLDDFYEEMGGDFLIIPSSVHELILIPKTQCEDTEVVNEMIRSINENEVPIDEVLSDHCYMYAKGEEALIF